MKANQWCSRVANIAALILLTIISAILFVCAMQYQNEYRRYFFTYCLAIFNTNTFVVSCISYCLLITLLYTIVILPFRDSLSLLIKDVRKCTLLNSMNNEKYSGAVLHQDAPGQMTRLEDPLPSLKPCLALRIALLQ